MSTIKVTNIQNESSATTNLALNTSGAVAVGQNLSVAGATTLTGALSVTGATTLTGSLASTLNLVAGTTTVAPLDFASGTNLTTAIAGAMEYDGKVFYGTPQSTQRGVIPGMQFFRLNADLAGANSTAAQNTFGVSVTLSASTVYAFEQHAVLNKAAGATSHVMSVGFGGTATINSILYTAAAPFAGAALPVSFTSLSNNVYGSISNTLSAVNILGTISSAAATASITIRGTVSINAGGTFTPQYSLSVAPGGAYSTVAGSYFLIYPIGASGANTSVGTWA